MVCGETIAGMGEITNLFAFLFAVLRHWRLLVTGMFLTLLFGGYEHLKQQSFSWKSYCLILAFTVFAAIYLAWREKQLLTQDLSRQLEHDKPRIQLNSGQILTTTTPDLNYFIKCPS